MQYTGDREQQIIAQQGDLLHRIELNKFFHDVGPDIELLCSNRIQGLFLRKYNNVGLPPNASEHTLGTIFEYRFARRPEFRAIYILWLFICCPAFVVTDRALEPRDWPDVLLYDPGN